MSRAYRISVAESLTRHVEVEDGVCTDLEILQVLPRERMANLLGAQLAGIGFEVEEKKAVRRDDDGIVIEVDLASGEVKVTLAASEKVDVELERQASVAEEHRKSGEDRLRQQVKAELEQKVENRKEDLRKQVTAKLEKKLRDIKRELDRATARTTGEALKERAAQLGEIQEISEDEQSGSMTIRVKV